ncbi:hypothetical protein B0H14DRAFT_3529239 [Mycena olivaceomarginata]|nr:hypothetical protein B0H14DRAFT_3529239 [Mycena olivaceomarginata]
MGGQIPCLSTGQDQPSEKRETCVYTAADTQKTMDDTHDAQLKGFWEEVIKINNNSGWLPFEKLLGANITPERAPVWDDWVAKNPKSKNFRNAGFDFYDQFDTIIPLVSAIPKGRNVYHAGQTSLLADLGLENTQDSTSDQSFDDGAFPPDISRRECPPWDLGRMDADVSQTTALDENNLPQPSDNSNESDVLHNNRPPSTPLVPSQSTSSIVSSTGRKRGPSDTPLPKGCASEKKPKSHGLPAHTPAKSVSSKFAKAQDVFSKLDSHMGDIISIMQTPKPAAMINDTPHRLTNTVTLARRERV